MILCSYQDTKFQQKLQVNKDQNDLRTGNHVSKIKPPLIGLFTAFIFELNTPQFEFDRIAVLTYAHILDHKLI